jgi:two-component system response regulator HydG
MAADDQPQLLVVDDDQGLCDMLGRYGRKLGYAVETCGGGRETMALLRTLHADVALVDLCMPEVNGLDVLKAIRDSQPECQVVLMTGHATVDTAVEAVQLGALDYLSKPFALNRIKVLLNGVHEEIDKRRFLLEADVDIARRLDLCGMIGRGPLMAELFALLKRIAAYARVALVSGETGTGKELVARALHQLGPRSRRTLVTVNCAAVVETLFESEVFGHVRGAFTGAIDNKAGVFEIADGGTLFLDEIGELPLALQAKLLRVLDTGEVHRVGAVERRKVDVRIVAATNRNLYADVDAGRFRRDLLYRLNVVEITAPPLRDRPDDIPHLTASFIADCRERFHVAVTGVSVAAEALLRQYAWPGNVRELRNVLERACMLADGQFLTDRDVAAALPAASSQGVRRSSPQPQRRVPKIECGEVLRVMQEVGGNKSAAARRLGVSRRALYRRLDAADVHCEISQPSDTSPSQ